MVYGLRLALFLISGLLCAQSVRVYSEFQRIDPSGNVIAVDKGARSREILSPAVVRGAYATFQAVVSVPEGAPFSLFIGQNPEDTVDVKAYRQVYSRRGKALIPDALEPVPVLDSGQISDTAPRAPGQNTLTYWLDLWIRPATPVGRFRLEVQLNIGEDWIIYPMEIRVLSAAPGSPEGIAGGPLGALEESADVSARRTLRAYLCGSSSADGAGAVTIRSLIRRNARQDMALARTLERALGKEALAAELIRYVAPGSSVDTWCKRPSFPGKGAEWYLRVRDYLYRMAGR